MLDALPPPDLHAARSSTTGQKQIDHRGLANPHITTDKDELAGAVDGALEPALQPLDVLLPPDDGSCRQWGRLFRIARHAKPIPLLGHRLEILRRPRRAPQGSTNLLDTRPQDSVGYVRAAPDVLA